MFYNKSKTRASRRKEIRENLSIIMASQSSRIVNRHSTSGPSPPTAAFGNVSISDVPKLVTTAQRTRLALGISSGSRGWLSTACSSKTIYRKATQVSSLLQTPIPNQSVFKVPLPPSVFPTPKEQTFRMSSSNGFSLANTIQPPNMSFLFKHVQRPLSPLPFESRTTLNIPSTPAPSSNRNNSRIIFQSPWVQRGQSDTGLISVTKQYSIKELIDILCGDVEIENVPRELDSFRQRVSASVAGKRSLFYEDTFYSTNDSILNNIIKRKRKSVDLFEDEPFVLDSLQEVQNQISYIFQ